MNVRERSIAVLAIQVVLVCSIAAKYLYERATCPRVWAQTQQYDPQQPMRGRYLALQMLVDACGLDKQSATHSAGYYNGSVQMPGEWFWRAKLVVQDGKLVPLAAKERSTNEELATVRMKEKARCQLATVTPESEFFIPEQAATPFPLRKGDELWVEVTMPPSGPPRPTQLALKKDGVWVPLHFN